MGRRRSQSGAQRHRQGQKPSQAQRAQVARVDAPGLHIALQPAHPLGEPVVQRPRRRLVGGASQHSEPPACAPKLEPQVRVLRDVPGVPAADRTQHIDAEMIAGAAQREGQSQTRHGRQGDLEQGGVLDRELAIQERRGMGPARQPADPQGRLEAGDASALVSRKAGGRLAKLQRIRVVLGVVDGQQIAGGASQPIVERPGLCLGRARRHDENLQPVGTRAGLGSLDCLQVMRFQQDKGLQSIRRVLDPAQSSDELGNNLRLVIQGGHDGVGGQRLCARNLGRRGATDQHQDDPPSRKTKETDLRHHKQGVEKLRRREAGRCRCPDKSHDDQDGLGPGKASLLGADTGPSELLIRP